MASTVKFGVTAEDNGFKQNLKQMATAAAEFSKEVGASGKGIMGLNQSLKTAKKAVMDLTLAYSQLSDEAKNSDFGKELAAQLDQAKKAAAELQDMRGDISQQIKNMASDTAGWDAMKEGIGAVGSSATALIGIMSSLTGESETAAETLKLMATAQATLNAVITVGNALQKQSALMTGIARAQSLAAAAAKALETKATIGATVAQKAFNIVASANPYVLLAMAIIGVGAALVGFASSMSDAKKEEEAMQKEMERAKEMDEKFADTVVDNSAEMIVKLFALKNALKDAGDNMQKKQEACEAYKDVIELTGESVNSLTGSEVDYDAKFQDMVNALTKRAMAMAHYALAIEEAKQKIKELAQMELKMGKIDSLQSNRKYTEGELREMGLDPNMFTRHEERHHVPSEVADYTEDEVIVTYTVDAAGRQRAKAQVQRDMDDFSRSIEEGIKGHMDKAAKYIGEVITTANKKTPRTPRKTTSRSSSTQKDITELEKLNKEYEKVEKKLENIKGDDAEAQQARQKIYNDLVRINKERIKYYDISTDSGYDNTIKALKEIISLTKSGSDEQRDARDAILETNTARIEELKNQGLNKTNLTKIIAMLEMNRDLVAKGTDEWKEYNNAIFAAQQALSDLSSEFEQGTLGHLQEMISNKQNLLLHINIDNIGDLKVIQDEILELTSQQQIIDLAINMFNIDSFKKKYDKLLDKFKNNSEISIAIKTSIGTDALQQLQAKTAAYTSGLIDFDQLKSEYDQLIQYLSSKGIDTTALTESINQAIQNVDMENAFKGLQEGASVRSFVDDLKEAKTKLEDIGLSSRAVFDALRQAGENAFNDLQAQYDEGLINADEFRDKCKELADILKEELGIEIEVTARINKPICLEAVDESIDALGSLGDAMSSIAQATDDEGLAVAGIIAKAIANVALGAATASAKASETGNPWVWLGFTAAAMAEMAAMIASIHSATGMESGGIVKGSTTVGDRVLTRLNSGEMVLNNSQQSHLFKALNDGINTTPAGPTTSTVKIKGSDLYLSMHNFYKTTKKSPFK